MTKVINKLVFHLKVLDKEQISITFGFDLDENLEEGDIEACTYLLHGLSAILREQQSYVLDRGQHEYESTVSEMILDEIENNEEILFEPDEELLQAIREAKVVPFKKTKLH
tara:strand:- start:586 stop:918 length:333 start_codon:yes stop_codon:yes gene_type:complete